MWPANQWRGGCAVFGIPVVVGLIVESWLIGVVTWLVLALCYSVFNLRRADDFLNVSLQDAIVRIAELERQVEELRARINDGLREDREDQEAANRRIAELELQAEALRNRLNRF